MDYQEILPHPLLLPYVENYWLLSLDGEGSGQQEEIAVPDGNTSLMFLSESVYRAGPGRRESIALKEQAVVVGQKSKPAVYLFNTGRRLEAFGIRFRPAGLSRFTPVPQAELKDAIVDAGLVFRFLLRQTQEQAILAGGLPQKALLANCFLLQNLQPESRRREQVEWAARQLQQGEFALPVLAGKLALHLRSLERLFSQYIGLNPKAFARVARFNAALHYRSQHPRRRLTEVAYAAGYFDQMHFIKDFKGFTSHTPRAYFREAGRNFHRYLNQLLQRRYGNFTAMP